MMINKRLIGMVPESKKYIAGNVACQWVSLAANITMMASITSLLEKLFERSAKTEDLFAALAAAHVAFLSLPA